MLMKSSRVFLLHLVFSTLGTFLTAILVRRFVMTLVWTLGARPNINFDVGTFALAFVPVGLIAGYLSFARLGGKSSLWIFVVPIGVLLLKIISYPAQSIFSSGPADGLRFFFGRAVCTAPSLVELTATASRCVSRMFYLGTCYSALAYSAGAFAKHFRVFEFDRHDGEARNETAEATEEGAQN